jgi:hypothetical protein
VQVVRGGTERAKPASGLALAVARHSTAELASLARPRRYPPWPCQRIGSNAVRGAIGSSTKSGGLDMRRREFIAGLGAAAGGGAVKTLLYKIKETT